MDFKEKYLKYKNKYIALKQDIYTQGDSLKNNFLQIGGAKCSYCNKDNALMMCPCRLAAYCNSDCQKAAWPTHRLSCSFAFAARKKERADKIKKKDEELMKDLLKSRDKKLEPLTREGALEEMKELWVRPNNPAALSTRIDQIIKEFRLKRERIKDHYGYALFRENVRNLFVEHFSWAIPHSSTLTALASKLAGYKNILEVGAGSGLWTYLLKELHNIPIRATDILDKSYGYDRKYKYLPIEQLDSIASIVKYDPEVLMMVWAPPTPLAYNSLKAFKGNLLVWIGYLDTGCNGDDKFFTELEENWEKVDDIDFQRWPAVFDECTIWQRKVLNPEKLLVRR